MRAVRKVGKSSETYDPGMAHSKNDFRSHLTGSVEATFDDAPRVVSVPFVGNQPDGQDASRLSEAHQNWLENFDFDPALVHRKRLQEVESELSHMLSALDDLSPAELHTLRRKIALRCHPDRFPTDMREEAHALMARANAAVDGAMAEG